MTGIVASLTAPLLGVALAVVALVALVEGFLLVETVRQVAQIRYRLDLNDRPTPVHLGQAAGACAPRLPYGSNGANFEAGVSLVALLSAECVTCRAAAVGLAEIDRRYKDLSVVTLLSSKNDAEFRRFIRETGMRTPPLQDDGRVAAITGISVRPTVVVVREGKITDAFTVQSARQVEQIAAEVVMESRGKAALLTSERAGHADSKVAALS